MKKLLIVESPNKIKKLKSILGGSWEVAASVGHIRDLPPKDTGVEAPDFKPQYVVSDRSKKTVDNLKKMASRCDQVILATDLDREGEAIAWHVAQVLRLKNPDRVTFGEITKKAVMDAVNNPRKINIPMVAAQETRRVVDRLYGWMVSPILNRMSSGQGLSAGRVQSVAVRVVVDREREIEAFTPVDYYEVDAHFDNSQWIAQWQTKALLQDKEDTTHWLDKAAAEAFVKALNTDPVFKIIDVERTERKRNALPPLITSTLQQAGSTKFDLSADETMRVAQRLFEEGLITYHRTDCPNLSDEAIQEIRGIISQIEIDHSIQGLLPGKKNTWSAKGDAQEAHEAIRPSDLSQVEPPNLSETELKVYQLIYNRALASQMAPAVFNVTKVKMASRAKFEGKQQPFLCKGEELVYHGWMAFVQDDKASSEKKTNTLPTGLKANDVLRAEKIALETKSTKAPPRYTEASLIEKMEKEGVGRPSTYASIMKRIREKSYIEFKKKSIFPTDRGKTVVDHLVGANFEFMDIEYTRRLEEVLDEVAKEMASYKGVVSNVHQRLSAEIDAINAKLPDDSLPCPTCSGGRLRRIFSKKNKQHFWGCSDRECKTTFPDIETDGKAAPDLEAVPKKRQPVVKTGVTCPKCKKGELVERHFKGSVFYGCNAFPRCKHTENDINERKCEEPAEV